VTVARILKAFLKEMAQVARHYDAFIRGFAGDRLMVVTEMEDRAATKALEIGISMRDVVRRVLNPLLAQRLGRNLAVGIGIDFGTMLAVKVGMQRTLEHSDLVWVGTPANTASKLTDQARPSEILISEEAYIRIDQALYSPNLWTSRNVNVGGSNVQVFSLAEHVSFGEALYRVRL
jgi:class 3 adenylate cyclase